MENRTKVLERNHHNKAVAVRAMTVFNDNVTTHFCKILKRREKQVPLDRVLFKVVQKEKGPTEQVDSSESIDGTGACPAQWPSLLLSPSHQP